MTHIYLGHHPSLLLGVSPILSHIRVPSRVRKWLAEGQQAFLQQPLGVDDVLRQAAGVGDLLQQAVGVGERPTACSRLGD